MRIVDYFLDIIQNDVQLFCVTISKDLGVNQSVRDVRLAGSANFSAIVICALAATSCEQLLQHRIVYDCQFGHFVHSQRNGNARMRIAVNEIDGAVDRIDDPCWTVR